MIALLGRGLILIAVLASSTGAFVGFAAGFRGSAAGAVLARRLAYVFAGAMIAANLLMVWALLARDFSVGYVAQVGSSQVPDWVAVTSLWSSLEGSILFWGLVLGGYVAAATWLNRDLDESPTSQPSCRISPSSAVGRKPDIHTLGRQKKTPIESPICCGSRQSDGRHERDIATESNSGPLVIGRFYPSGSCSMQSG